MSRHRMKAAQNWSELEGDLASSDHPPMLSSVLGCVEQSIFSISMEPKVSMAHGALFGSIKQKSCEHLRSLLKNLSNPGEVREEEDEDDVCTGGGGGGGGTAT